MSLRWHAVVVDCHDVRAQSRWWAEALGWQIADENDDDQVVLLPPQRADATGEMPQAARWPGLLFQAVPEGDQLRNGVYLTLAPPEDGDQHAEIGRLEAMGAKLIAMGVDEVDWVIMEDPEGNGFSVLGPRG